MRILFATSVLSRGHGVSLVISELAKRIIQSYPKAEIAVAAINHDSEYAYYLAESGISVLPCSYISAKDIVNDWNADIFDFSAGPAQQVVSG